MMLLVAYSQEHSVVIEYHACSNAENVADFVKVLSSICIMIIARKL
jgi:hypothetical protein